MPEQGPVLIANAMELLLDAVCIVDREGTFVFVGGASERIFGYRADEMVGKPMIDLVLPEDRERTLRAAAEIMAGQPQTLLRNRYVRKDGTIVHIMWSAQSGPDGMRVAVARDISRLVRAESLQAAVYAISEAAHAAQDLPALFREIGEVVGQLASGSSLLVALCEGQESESVTFPGELGGSVLFGASREAAEDVCTQILRRERTDRAEDERGGSASVQHTCDAEGHVWRGIPLRTSEVMVGVLLLRRPLETADAEGDKELLQFISVQVASTIQRKQAELRLRQMALYDPLTALPNRSLLEDRLRTSCLRARRSQSRMAVLFIDLDGFKAVNDRYGHAMGDALLEKAAERLKGCVRESDSMGRLGGDEFAAVLDGVGVPENALLVAERICAALAQPFEVAGRSISISSSIGVALYPDHGTDGHTLMGCADQAMYAAKTAGKNRVCMSNGLTHGGAGSRDALP
jgi:diguanylate cyclase (GGDEF)-like protein/PAS domain S-box-containing protein